MVSKACIENFLQKAANARKNRPNAATKNIESTFQEVLDTIAKSEPKADVFEKYESLSDFCLKCLNLPNDASKEDLIKIKNSYNMHERKAINTNFLKEFAKYISELTTTLEQSTYANDQRLANILNSLLLKTLMHQPNQDLNTLKHMEKLADKSILYHKKMKDSMHILGRLHLKKDIYLALVAQEKEKAHSIKSEISNCKKGKLHPQLKEEYKKCKEAYKDCKIKLYYTLKEAYKYESYIINHYKKACEKFQSLQKAPTPLTNIIIEKGSTCENIAEMVSHKKRNAGIFFLKEAEKCYKKVKRNDIKIIIEKSFKNIKTSILTNKLQKSTMQSVRSAIYGNRTRRQFSRKISNCYVSYKSKIYDEQLKKT